MSCTQNNVFNTTKKLGYPAMGPSGTCSSPRATFVHMPALCIYPFQTLKHHKMPNLVSSFPKFKTCAPICLFGGKGNSRGENKAFSWDLLKDTFKGLRKEKTIQDMLRDQMRQQEFGGGDGGDGNPPGRGGRGSDGTEDEGFAGPFDDTLQVVLATLALLFVYIYIIKGAGVIMLARDCIKYLFGGLPSVRLKRIIDKWNWLNDDATWAREDTEDWLVRSIVTTPTWWYSPDTVARVIKKKLSEQRSGAKLKQI